MSNFDYRRDSDSDGPDAVYSKAIKAGRRTYFFDVKATRGDEYYITITESRKKSEKDGTVTFDKHKLYLYKEDFKKFAEGYEDVVNYIRRTRPETFDAEPVLQAVTSIDEEFEQL